VTGTVTTGVGRVHVLLDRFDRHAPADLARAALRGGATTLQLRATHLTDRERFDLAHQLLPVCRDAGGQLLVDDRADIAAAVGADGVHLGAHDLPIPAARALLGPHAVIGATARDPDAGAARVAEGASYLGVGPTFATTSKDGLPDPLGPAAVAAVAAAVPVPVVAIAGITVDGARQVAHLGVHGVAVIGLVAAAADPAAVVADLVAAVEGRS
jgi:thiamine-phosphate pyrophosphorylase